MKTIDLIVVAPKSLDYPRFRKTIHDIKYFFNKIHYVFSGDFYFHDYSHFIKQDLPFVNFIESKINGDRDWRDQATNDAIKMAESDKILFIEPDFVIDKNTLFNLPWEYEVISYYDNAYRIWPSFLCVDRCLIEKTLKNFSAGQFEYIKKINPQNVKTHIDFKNELVDHFGKFTSDLLSITDNFYFLNEHDVNYYHYAGITHNFNLCRDNNINYIYKPQEFISYLEDSVTVDINKSEFYIDECIRYKDIIKKHFKL